MPGDDLALENRQSEGLAEVCLHGLGGLVETGSQMVPASQGRAGKEVRFPRRRRGNRRDDGIQRLGQVA